jgi:hypothetical protein
VTSKSCGEIGRPHNHLTSPHQQSNKKRSNEEQRLDTSDDIIETKKIDYVDLMLTNSITKRVTTEVKENILRPYLENNLPYVPDQELVSHKFHVKVMKELPLKNVINGNRHVSKEIEGILLMAIIGEYLNRYAISKDADADYSVQSFAQQFPDIYGKAWPHLSPKFKLETVVDVWKVFNVAIHKMKIPVSANKSSLLVAANLLSDPERAMTTGSRQVVRTECVIELFHAVSGYPISERPSRGSSNARLVTKRRRGNSISSTALSDEIDDLTSVEDCCSNCSSSGNRSDIESFNYDSFELRLEDNHFDLF